MLRGGLDRPGRRLLVSCDAMNSCLDESMILAVPQASEQPATLHISLLHPVAQLVQLCCQPAQPQRAVHSAQDGGLEKVRWRKEVPRSSAALAPRGVAGGPHRKLFWCGPLEIRLCALRGVQWRSSQSSLLSSSCAHLSLLTARATPPWCSPAAARRRTGSPASRDPTRKPMWCAIACTRSKAL